MIFSCTAIFLYSRYVFSRLSNNFEDTMIVERTCFSFFSLAWRWRVATLWTLVNTFFVDKMKKKSKIQVTGDSIEVVEMSNEKKNALKYLQSIRQKRTMVRHCFSLMSQVWSVVQFFSRHSPCYNCVMTFK